MAAAAAVSESEPKIGNSLKTDVGVVVDDLDHRRRRVDAVRAAVVVEFGDSDLAGRIGHEVARIVLQRRAALADGALSLGGGADLLLLLQRVDRLLDHLRMAQQIGVNAIIEGAIRTVASGQRHRTGGQDQWKVSNAHLGSLREGWAFKMKSKQNV